MPRRDNFPFPLLLASSRYDIIELLTSVSIRLLDRSDAKSAKCK